ncbi:Cytochrome P450 [Rhizoctonia solani]|uniref:Cytochrome P450 n=1 Tax=Rhizoctonia solani TaxID=456999 RepID=A0A8H7III8_9AGAM|nr:Cytochrome P450 [Rhizoctonia solani]
MSRRYLERMSVRVAMGASDLMKLWDEKLGTVGSCAFEAGIDIQLATMDTILNIIMGHPLGCVESTRAALQLNPPQKKDGIALIPRSEVPPLYNAVNAMMKSMHGASRAAFPSVYAVVSCYASPSWRKQYNLISSFLNDAIIDARNKKTSQKKRREAREGAEKFEKDEILDELMMYVFAGQDTTASALRWLVKYLATDPQIQRRLHEEVCSVFNRDGDATGPLDFELLDDSDRVPVLEAVVAETLRHAGIGSLIARELLQDEVALGRLIPKGTYLMFATAMMSRDESEWGPDANEWRPTRWLRPDGTFNRLAGPSFPFGVGHRACFGQRLAVLQLKHFVAAMARSFFFKPVPHEVGTWEAIETITKQPKLCYISLERWKSM